MEKLRVLGEFFFSQIQGKPIYDHQGRRVGKLRDLAICWEGDTPRVTGIKYARHTRNIYRWTRWPASTPTISTCCTN